jgi:uncharacterized tellurite resistance protein B-like protein
MIKGLKDFFHNTMTPVPAAEDDAHRLRVATCALLLEAAHADRDFSDEEREQVTRIVRDRFDLSTDEAAELIALADRERRESTDLYQFARLINDTFPKPRKLAVVELLWSIVYSDGVLEAHEDALMRRLGNVLGIRHEDLMAVKVKVKREREE